MNPRWIVPVFLGPLVTSCAVGPKYMPPQSPMPPSWHAVSATAGTFDRSTIERWWTAFQDPLLDDLVVRAIDGNLGWSSCAGGENQTKTAAVLAGTRLG
jgi:outer membrane protein TolC